MEDDSQQGFIAFIKSIFKKKASPDNSNNLADEIQDLMDEGHAKGLISDEESEMVHGVLDLKETRVHSIMIPRTEISSASDNATLEEIIKLVNDCGHTRIPIYRKNIDGITGILHAKDLIKLIGKEHISKIPTDFLRPPYFVPGTQKVGQLLRDLKQMKTLAIVTDEYGGTAGIITIEDIIEEIVGEIMDEHDEDPPLLKVMDDENILVDARLEVEKLEEHLNIELPKGDFESVGGFIIHLIGRIPKIHEKIPYRNMEIIIKKSDQRKIDKILIKLKPQSDSFEKENSHR